MELIQLINLTAGIWGSFLCVISMAGIGFLPTKNKRVKWIFVLIFAFGAAYQLLSTGGMLLANRPEQIRQIRHLYAWSCAASFGLLAVINEYFFWVLQRKTADVRGWRILSLTLALAGIVTGLLNLFRPLTYQVTELGTYEVTVYYYVPLLIALGMQLILVALFFFYRRILNPWEKAFLLYTGWMPMAVLALQWRFTYIQITNTSVTVLMMIFCFMVLFRYEALLGAQADAMARQTAELQEQKTRIMLSQIQPHFLFNSLNSIYYLCGKDPEVAQQAIADFSSYLRVNLDSLKVKELIPFQNELQHVKTYLKLEQLRFDERLTVYYDIECCDFRIPVLTVQPLVENAVKHGICHLEQGGSVQISTRDAGEYIEIQIIDNGAGFDPMKLQEDRDRSHIGIDNVRRRLKSEAGGILVITSTPGVGTTAQIRLPKEQVK